MLHLQLESAVEYGILQYLSIFQKLLLDLPLLIYIND